jgi:hypothetical protein
MPTVSRYNSCPYSATGNTPAVCHFTPQSPDSPPWAKVEAHVQKVRGKIIESDKKVQISLGDNVFVVPRIWKIMKD